MLIGLDEGLCVLLLFSGALTGYAFEDVIVVLLVVLFYL